jgi:phage tail-like protein
MDANGLRFWTLAESRDWDRFGTPRSTFDQSRRVLRLASARRLTPAQSETAEDIANPLLDLIPQAVDSRGYAATWDAGRRAVVVDFGHKQSEIFQVPEGPAPTDVAVGHDNVLYVAVAGGVVLRDLKQRWRDVRLELADFDAWRLAPDPSGGSWVLGRNGMAVARVSGHPLPEQHGEFLPETFRPVEENPDPPRMVLAAATQFAAERVVAIACSPESRVAVLSWPDGADARLRVLAGGVVGNPRTLSGAFRPYSIAWVDATQVAVLLFGLNEAPVFSADMDGDVVPAGELYPLPGHSGGPFAHGLGQPPHYSAGDTVRPLFHLSLPSYAEAGGASNATTLDSGDAQTVWHRLYVEASIPANTGIRVLLAATDRPVPPSDDSPDWHPHVFGEAFRLPLGSRVPRGSWCSQPSEIPFHGGLLPCQREPGRAGLFTVLIQRSARRVTALRGRYLWIKAELASDGRSTPEIAAVRAYASRFSYADRYLPEIYREELFSPDADELGPATPADFFERYLDLFESVLTPMEDRIASSYQLTDPRTVPEESIEWLGNWIGASFDSAVPVTRRRDMLAHSGQMVRKRGTLKGLQLALEYATGGGVSGGEIVVLEDYRLRRTFATILGADLADEDDPLLGGIAASGNSFVGDTLILGNEHRPELMALFRPDADDSDEDDIRSFFERLAFRVTILVHQEIEPRDLALIRRIATLEAPAHIDVKVLKATFPFMVAVSSLVGVDTYLSKKPPARPVRVGVSTVGADLLEAPAGFDPRRVHEAQEPERPIAQLPPVLTVPFERSFTLVGAGSRAGVGRRLARYRWTLLP